MRGRLPVPIEERFWPKVAKGDGCWEWTAHRNADGYGQIQYQGQSRMAHRIAYELTVGPVPSGMLVLHSCDNPPCVNPAHLRVGTHADNSRDAVERDRTWRGAQHHLSKLSWEQVCEIRRLYEPGRGPNNGVRLAERFGVTPGAVYHILRGVTRKAPDNDRYAATCGGMVL